MKPAALALGLLAGALASSAQANMNHADHAMPAMSMQAMNRVMVSELRPLRGQAFDIRWTQLMIGHHQMALDMAQYITKNGRDARVRANAQQVIKAQQREINQMKGWLKAWDAPLPKAMSPMTVKLTGNESADRWFMREMIPHHQGAVDMAKLAPTRSKNPDLLKLAANIIKAQRAEINEYRTWLRSLK